jgi:hypothetical protein
MEPLCVSALNTPAERSSGQVFLRVLRDSLLGGRGSSNLLIPRTDLSSLLPDAAAAWLGQQAASLRLGCRVERLEQASPSPANAARAWLVNGEAFNAVLWATSPSVASQQLGQVGGDVAPALQAWAAHAASLQHEAIATVYLQTGRIRLPQPMLALRSSSEFPAQFVFDRGQLGGPAGLLACVVSASHDARAVLQEKVLRQVQSQLGALLQGEPVMLQTVLEKRATFACTPGLVRPPQAVAPGLLACGDYVEGPYPATLEGAVQSGIAAARALAAKA